MVGIWYMFPCVPTTVRVDVCVMCVCMSIEARSQSWVLLLRDVAHLFVRQGLLLPLSLLRKLNWLASTSEASTCLCVPSPVIISTHMIMSKFLMWVLRNETQTLMLV